MGNGEDEKFTMKKILFPLLFLFVLLSGCDNKSLKGTEWKSTAQPEPPSEYALIKFNTDTRGSVLFMSANGIEEIEDFEYYFDKQTKSGIIKGDNTKESPFIIEGKNIVSEGQVMAIRVK